MWKAEPVTGLHIKVLIGKKCELMYCIIMIGPIGEVNSHQSEHLQMKSLKKMLFDWMNLRLVLRSTQVI